MRVGLEIHQRLATGKLFCSCPNKGERVILSLERELHPVPSEMGEVDRAASVEARKRRRFIYEVTDNSCLVECDEEPIHEINRKALCVAIAVARALNMAIVDEVHVMRKTVIDGSNTSGFQRTMVVGLDGYIETSKGRVGITSLCLEEESAGIVERKGDTAVYRLDRLGIPLVEITTAPDIVDPEHAKEVAQRIGTLLRMTGWVERGIGTIRQDVNVSVEGGARVEIKGAQDLRALPDIIENEVKRQRALIGMLKYIPPKPREYRVVDVTDHITGGPRWMLNIIKGGGRAKALILPGLKGLLGVELLPGRRFGTELSDHAKVYGFGGLIHGDEDLKKYGLEGLPDALDLGKDDNFALLVGNPDLMEAAFSDIFERAYLKKVPEETRRVVKEVYTEYMRPMASGARMYPETDHPPILMDKGLIKESESYAPLNPKVLRRELEGELGKDVADQMMRSIHLFDYLRLRETTKNRRLLAVIITNTLKNLSREGLDVGRIDAQVLTDLLNLYDEGKIAKKGIEEILRYVCKGEGRVEEVVAKHDLWRITGDELKRIIEEEGRDLKRIFSKYRLRVEADEVKKLLGD